MRALTNVEASALLAPLGLIIGRWNELVEIDYGKRVVDRQCIAPKEGRELYSFSQQLLDWLSSKTSDWVLLQIDNSTAPLPGEARAFSLIAHGDAGHWDFSMQRTFVLERGVEVEAEMFATRLRMLVLLALMFEWHVHLTCPRSGDRRRLSLLDGVAYLFGEEGAVSEFQATV
jgi:hypothetical protein